MILTMETIPHLMPQLRADLGLAVAVLNEGWSACAVRNGGVLGRARGKRLEPALRLLTELRGEDLLGPQKPCVFADKVLGLAAFRLACLLGAKAAYGEVASSLAVDEGRRKGVFVACHKIVPAIMNIRRDGLCPMENLAFRSESDYEFFLALRRRG